MRSVRLMLSAVLISMSTVVFAQTDAKTVVQTDAQKSFSQMKTLEGTWEGHVTTFPQQKEMEGKAMHVSWRATSMGNALMHEMRGDDAPDDPITMFYMDDGRLLLTHFCDAGNRPRMVGKMSADGKTVDFVFVDVAGSLQYGHMQHATFTTIDANHHTEDWTYMQPGDKPVRAHVDLVRTKQVAAVATR